MSKPVLNPAVRRMIVNVLPPFIVHGLEYLLARESFRGTYASFREALEACGSKGLLQDQKYVDKAFRDDHTNPPPDAHHMEVLAAFASPLLNRPGGGPFRVLDFGGGMGNFYFFMRNHLPASLRLRWDIFDTELMAQRGRATYRREELSYFSEWKDVSANPYDMILASACLQLFEDPYQELTKLASVNCRYLILHEVPVLDGETDRISIKRPPPIKVFRIHRGGNYPLFPRWFFSESQLLNFLSGYYVLSMQWPSGNPQTFDGRLIGHQSYLLEKKAFAEPLRRPQ